MTVSSHTSSEGLLVVSVPLELKAVPQEPQPGGVVAMFRCHSVKLSASRPGGTAYETITLFPVAGRENEPWSKFTPSGSCELTVTNPAAMGRFAPGLTYRLTLSRDEETSAIDQRASD